MWAHSRSAIVGFEEILRVLEFLLRGGRIR
jgi:hypothetical protein